MIDTNKELLSDEVERGLEILESSGDNAMDNYLFPRGMNWIELYLNNMRGGVEQSLAHIKTIRDNFILKDAEDIKLTQTFDQLTINAAEIVRRAERLKEIFRSHFGVFLEEVRTSPKVCLDKDEKE